MFKYMLLGLVLALSSTSAIPASSRHLIIDQNCQIWGDLARKVIENRELGDDKKTAVGNVVEAYVLKNAPESVVDNLKTVLGKIYDTAPKSDAASEVAVAVYQDCMNKSVVEGSK